MTRTFGFLLLDVFTERALTGNQLAAFLDGRGLDAATMQAMAREMNSPESVFVFPSEDERTVARLRIFSREAFEPGDFTGCFAINAKVEFEGQHGGVETACVRFSRDLEALLRGLCERAGYLIPTDCSPAHAGVGGHDNLRAEGR